MGNCKYCGRAAGFLSSKHAECDDKYQTAQYLISRKISNSIINSESLDDLENAIEEISKDSFISHEELKRILIDEWSNAIDVFLEDGILQADEEKRLIEFKEKFALSDNELDAIGALTKAAKAGVIRDILNGIIPKRISVEGMPINLQKDEQIVWAFPNSKYLEDKNKRHYTGGMHGVSIRVAKGLYYRVGGFRGNPVETIERIHVDTGWVFLTNKHIYFAGPQKSFRVPYKKIVSFQNFSDGIGIIRDATTAKPQIFVTGDGWFTYNLATNLSRM